MLGIYFLLTCRSLLLSSELFHQVHSATNWRFNSSLLKDEDFIKYFKNEWASYLHNNGLPGTSASAFLESGMKRENKRIHELEKNIKSLEEACVSSLEQEMLSKIRKAKLELNQIWLKKKKEYFYYKDFHCKDFNKKQKIPCIPSSVYDPERINNTFRDFKKTLYSPDLNPSEDEVDQFLDNITIPKLSASQAWNQAKTLYFPSVFIQYPFLILTLK